MARLDFFPALLDDSSSSSEDDRRPRIILERNNFMEELDDTDFRKRFRMNKQTVNYIANLLDPGLEPISTRNQPISKMSQILISLRFYATGSYQMTIADVFDVSQPTVSRIITKITRHIAQLRPNFIKMPETAAERRRTAQEFFEISGFPLVMGNIDCTHIKIISPGGNAAEVFRNRKDYFSINTQIIGNANLEILDVVARWPGSVHDTTINDSRIRLRLENQEFSNYHLLDDSGYPCRSYLLTPIINPHTRAEERYNRAHIRTRNAVERLFGLLKRRFPCLARGMALSPPKVCAIIVATAVLHNICKRENDNGEDFVDVNDEGIDNENICYVNVQNEMHNTAVRTALIETVFQ